MTTEQTSSAAGAPEKARFKSSFFMVNNDLSQSILVIICV